MLKTSEEILKEKLNNRREISPGKETEVKDNGKTLREAARENMVARHQGKHHIDGVKSNLNRKEVNCIMCGRKMTTAKDENPPFYCFKCHDEAEGVWGLG